MPRSSRGSRSARRAAARRGQNTRQPRSASTEAHVKTPRGATPTADPVRRPSRPTAGDRLAPRRSPSTRQAESPTAEAVGGLTRGLQDAARRGWRWVDENPGAITFAVVAAAVLFVLSQLQPRLLIADSTPNGGDTGAHVWGPDYLRHHLLPQGRITGWAPDWYAGFPAYFFYFPLPALMVVALDLVLPYGIALKLITVSGLVAMPAAAYAFGRLSGMRFPGPALLSVATVPFLFYYGFKDTATGAWSFSIYGGNIISTFAGEFSFAISLSFALVFLGLFARMLETGQGRALTAVALALTGLSHIIPTTFALAGALVFFLLRPGSRRFRVGVGTLAVGGLLAAFWWFPFLIRLPYTNNMGWEKITKFRENLFPYDLRWVLILAACGVVLSVAHRRRTGLALVGLATMSLAAFVVLPDGKIWNARMLPFWYLSLFLLAGFAVAELGTLVSRLLADDPKVPIRAVVMGTPLVAGLAAWLYVGLPLNAIPDWIPLSTTNQSIVPGWGTYNYTGYEKQPAYPEYKSVMDTMNNLGDTRGCGRAHWEYQSAHLERYGTTLSMMLLPYWTDGCIGSMEGLYFESSPTVPYHFLNATELSKEPSQPQRRLPYTSFDVREGVRHLQQLGVRYYMAFSPEAIAQAQALTEGPEPQLEQVASVASWRIYEVRGSELVTPLSFEPAVLDGLHKGGVPFFKATTEEGWLAVGVKWFNDRSARVFVAESGPKNWPRVALRRTTPPQTLQAPHHGADVVLDPLPERPVAPALVSDIRAGRDSISFNVDKPGTPVLVKASYFPNWKASGADGPWRVSPNLMVVVPTERQVSLRYVHTPVDITGWLLTGLGVVGVIALRRRGPAEFDDPEPAGDSTTAVDDDKFEAVVKGGGRVPQRVTAVERRG